MVFAKSEASYLVPTDHLAFSTSSHTVFIVSLYAATLSVVFVGIRPYSTIVSSASFAFCTIFSISLLLDSVLYEGLVA
jgi:hypothetical protein